MPTHNSAFKMHSPLTTFIDSDGTLYPWIEPDHCHQSPEIDWENPIQHGPATFPLWPELPEDLCPF